MKSEGKGKKRTEKLKKMKIKLEKKTEKENNENIEKTACKKSAWAGSVRNVVLSGLTLLWHLGRGPVRADSL